MNAHTLTWQECAAAGMSQVEAARARGVSAGAACQAARRLGLEFKKSPHGRQPSRAEDEAHLEWIRLRCLGVMPTEIGRRYGVPASTVKPAIRRVLEADVAHSGEQVAAYYWEAAE